MKGDFTRDTFDSKKHYSSVRMQQGRVTLDADWNEQVDIATHRVETEAADIIGGCGGPIGAAGFEISVPSSGVFSSTVAGTSTATAALRAPAAARAALPIATDEVAIGLQPINLNPVPGDLIIGAGHYYVDGILCENESSVSLTTQPDLPGQTALSAAGLYVIYLHVWKRDLTALDDPSIREVALGGPDTATRTKIVWQVEALPILKPPDAVYCSTSFPEWDALIAPRSPRPRLRARANPATPNADPCGPIPAGAGFRGLENQLYRVEIHTPGVLGAGPSSATFKWQRDNASIAAQWLDQNGSDLKVSSTGRDSVLNIAAGQWVELTDDTHELKGSPGTLVKVTAVQGDIVTIDPGNATISRANLRNPCVRRWDGTLPLAQPTPDGYIALESGVEVRFERGSYHTGDYWLIPARSLTADVEWPVDATPVALPPRGIEDHYCRLALVSIDGAGAVQVLQDCRCLFPRLCQPGIHITDVKGIGGVSLQNDSPVQVTRILNGIEIVCDGPVGPATISRAVCFLTVDVPFRGRPGQSVAAYQRIVVAADVRVSAAGNTIQWRPKNGNFLAQMPYHLAMASTPPAAGDLGVLARVVLKGNYIWDPKMPSRYLDGEAFGVTRSDGTDWRPPSGNGASGGDFEMWFWLTPDPQTQPLTFKVEATATLARWEGFNELVGDIVLKCTGGIPTENGNPVPTYNIVVSTDPLEISSPQLTPSERIDVVLLVDEPTGFGSNGAHPRLFLGERISTTSTKSVLFRDIPLESPMFGEVLTLRIKNLRVNATPLFAAGTSTSSGGSIGIGSGSEITATARQGSAPSPAVPPDASVKIRVSVTITGSQLAQPVVVENVVVASALPGVSVTAVPNSGQPFPLVITQSGGVNSELLSQPTSPAPPNVHISFYLQFNEGFLSAFRVRKSAAASPPGQLLQESGFEGPQPLYFVGNSDTGTRLRVRFDNIPVGVQIFVTTHDVTLPLDASSQAPVQARLAPTDVFEGGAGSVPNPALFVPETGGLTIDGVPVLAVPVANGSGVVEWEWVAQDVPKGKRPVLFGVVAAALSGPQSIVDIRVSAGLAPNTQPTVPSFTKDALKPPLGTVLGTVISVKK